MSSRYRKLTPDLIRAIHRHLAPDASRQNIQLYADAWHLSYSTVWHVVRGYGRTENPVESPWLQTYVDAVAS